MFLVSFPVITDEHATVIAADMTKVCFTPFLMRFNQFKVLIKLFCSDMYYNIIRLVIQQTF